ncbi:MAG TPA: hypothetical protein VMU94_31700 [Streptosporangiaceae bacterium]|nr:hypothetical protein [Streptosporangiaceae bacterium]
MTPRGGQEPGKRPEAGGRHKPPLGVRAVLVAAARAGRRYGWRILAVAVVVSLVTALADIVVKDVVDRANLPVTLAADLSASGVTLLGTVFLSGFLSKLVGAGETGSDRPPVRKIVRTLPWGRLIGADLLVALIVLVGVIALVIPGLVAANLLAVVGPVIEIENKPVLAALRRSAHLVRQHFWTVALLVLVPVTVASEINTFAPEPRNVRSVLEILAVRGLGEGLAEAAIGLILVTLCRRLIALDRAPAAAGGQQPRDRAPAGSGDEQT